MGLMNQSGTVAYDANIDSLLPSGTLGIAGASVNIASGSSAAAVAAQINSATSSTGATAEAYTSVAFGVMPIATNQQVTLRLVAGDDYSKAEQVTFEWDGSDQVAQAAMQAINAVAAKTGIVAEDFISGSRVGNGEASFRLSSTSGETLHVLNDSVPATELVLRNADWTDTKPFTLLDLTWEKPGGNGTGVFGSDDVWVVGRVRMDSTSGPISISPDGFYDIFGDPYGHFLPESGGTLPPTSDIVSLEDVSFESASSASKSLKVFDGALQQVSNARAELGAIQSRLETTISNLQTSTENLSASRSRIQDADFAAETASLTRQQILQQAGTVMLVQANQVSQQILSLLK